MYERLLHWLTFFGSLAIAFVGNFAPRHTMPIDWDRIVSWSIPLASVWVGIFIFSIWRFKVSALWQLLGAPLVLYWPLWLLWNGFPSCYHMGNCA